MRNLFPASLMMAIIFAGCTGNLSPRETAEGYLDALSRLDFDAASHFVADEGRTNFNFLKKLYSDLGPDEQKKFQVSDWKVTAETVNGDTATIDFLFDQVKKGQMTLQRVKGLWKVDHRQTF